MDEAEIEAAGPDGVSEANRVDCQVDLDATLDEVWSALTDPGSLGEWLGSEVDIDLRPAGTGRVVERDGTVRQVLVTDVEPQQRIAWHWWDDRGDLSSVELTVEPLVDATRVRVIEVAASLPAGGVQASACSARWTVALASLRVTTRYRAAAR